MHDPKTALEGLIQRFRAHFSTTQPWPYERDLGSLHAHSAYREAELWLLADIAENLGVLLDPKAPLPEPQADVGLTPVDAYILNPPTEEPDVFET